MAHGACSAPTTWCWRRFAFLGGTNRKQMQAKLGEPDGGIMDYLLHFIPCTNARLGLALA